jgi:hypothetical protein
MADIGSEAFETIEYSNGVRRPYVVDGEADTASGGMTRSSGRSSIP